MSSKLPPTAAIDKPECVLSGRDESAQKLRIALMLPNLEIGGAQEVVCGLARGFAELGCRPIVCSLFSGGALEQELLEQGTPYESLDLKRRPIRKLPFYMADMSRLWRRLRQFFLEHDINVVQTNNLGSQDFFVLAVARQLGIPVTTFNFQDERVFPAERVNDIRSRIQRRMYRISRRWAGEFVAVSPETKASIIRQTGLTEDKVATICNAVDVQRFSVVSDKQAVRRELGLPSSARLLITVATLKPQKGHTHLIEAAKVIVANDANAHLLFVGDGELRSDLEKQARSSGVSDHIHFLGSRRDVHELLVASDLFILPSLFEGLSMALLESMAAGVPVVATAVSGTTTVVDNDRVGTLVPPADPNALAEATLELLSRSTREIERLCRNAQQRVSENFSLTKQAREYLALYDEILRAN